MWGQLQNCMFLAITLGEVGFRSTNHAHINAI